MPRILVVLLVLVLASTSHARGVNAPFSINSTQVLPSGVRAFSVSAMTMEVDTWFNNQGLVTGVAEPMAQDLTYRRLIDSEKDPNLKSNIKSQLQAKGIDLDSVAGRSLADVNTRVTVTLPSLAYGINSWWTMAIAVPILYTEMRTATSFAGTAQLQSLVNEFAKKSRQQTKKVEAKLQDVIATELSAKDYLPLEDRQQTEVGDITLVSKMLLFNGLNIRWAMVNQLTAPTGRVRAANRLIDPAAGDGQWDVGVSSIVELPITGKLSLIHQVGHLFQLADHQDTRVPLSTTDFLSPIIDENAYRDMGDITSTQFSVVYRPLQYVNLGAAYKGAYKQRDFWTGGLAPQDRYDFAAINTNQIMHAALFNVGYSTVPFYRQGTFALPLSFNLYYTRVFDGRNVNNADLWSANASLFF